MTWQQAVFQFLLVRLKEWDRCLEVLNCNISIPFGAIKSSSSV